MNFITYKDHIAYSLDKFGRMIEYLGIGVTTKTIRAYSTDGSEGVNMKIGTDVGFILKEENGTTKLTLKHNCNNKFYQVVVDEADLPLDEAAKKFGLNEVSGIVSFLDKEGQ